MCRFDRRGNCKRSVSRATLFVRGRDSVLTVATEVGDDIVIDPALLDGFFVVAFWSVAGIVLAPYVLGPVLVHTTQKIRREPTLIAFDPDEQPAPRAVQEFLDKTAAALRGCGFEVLAHVVLPDLVPNVKALFVLLSRPASNDNAVAVALFASEAAVLQKLVRTAATRYSYLVPEPRAPLRKSYVEFATDYADGLELCTNNNSEESAYRRLPHRVVLQPDFIEDPAELWRFHERATRELGTGPKQPCPSPDEALDHLRDAMVKEQNEQVDVGWLWFDEDSAAFRPSWKGACLITWKLCWPVAALRRAARRRRARRLLHEWRLEPAA